MWVNTYCTNIVSSDGWDAFTRHKGKCALLICSSMRTASLLRTVFEYWLMDTFHDMLHIHLTISPTSSLPLADTHLSFTVPATQLLPATKLSLSDIITRQMSTTSSRQTTILLDADCNRKDGRGIRGILPVKSEDGVVMTPPFLRSPCARSDNDDAVLFFKKFRYMGV